MKNDSPDLFFSCLQTSADGFCADEPLNVHSSLRELQTAILL